MSCILMPFEWEVTCCEAATRLLFCVSMARWRAGVAPCTLSFCSAANGYPINHISLAYELIACLYRGWLYSTQSVEFFTITVKIPRALPVSLKMLKGLILLGALMCKWHGNLPIRI